MSQTQTVAQRMNGHKPRAVPPRVPDPVAEHVDRLLDLRSLIKTAQDAERDLTAQVLAVMTRRGLTALTGQHGVATKTERVRLQPDPALFVELVGLDRGAAALSVSVTQARALLGETALLTISDVSRSAVLTVEPIK